MYLGTRRKSLEKVLRQTWAATGNRDEEQVTTGPDLIRIGGGQMLFPKRPTP